MRAPDLHVHSTASDGILSPSEIVALAVLAECPAIALTDHDTVDGVAEAMHAARGTSVEVIPAVELSAGIGDRDIHILGYWIDHEDGPLLARLQRLAEIRVARAVRILETLDSSGIHVAMDEVLSRAGGGTVGRAHIAQTLVSAGHATGIDDAFRRLLGRAAPHYVPKPVRPAEEVIGWITQAGGVAVLAHPGLSEADDLIAGLVSAGIAGIEAYHPSHDADAADRYVGIASSHGLIVTGGTDFHGTEDERCRLGSLPVPDSVVRELRRVRPRSGADA